MILGFKHISTKKARLGFEKRHRKKNDKTRKEDTKSNC